MILSLYAFLASGNRQEDQLREARQRAISRDMAGSDEVGRTIHASPAQSTTTTLLLMRMRHLFFVWKKWRAL
jgi:hypothetical protein